MRRIARLLLLANIQAGALGYIHKGSAPEAALPVLPGREQELLALTARGFLYVEIAQLSRVTVRAVQSHIKNLHNKRAVHNKSNAVYEATRLG